MINIQLPELKRVYSRSIDVKAEFNNQLSTTNNTLNDICTNVRSTSLTNSTMRLTTSISNILNSIDKNLSIVNEFMNRQIALYEQTNVDTKAQLDSLVSTIETNLGASIK